MQPEIRFDCSGVNWQLVADTLQEVGMAHYAAEAHQQAFEASHTVVFLYHNQQMIGFGRAISDGVYQAAVYDVAVVPQYQGHGLGRTIMQAILARVSHCNVILYASIGKEPFYRSLGFRLMKTGMALFKQVETMAAKGFTE
ncbi:GNAT family N-acetyltransferase [Trichlorobacter lovleyi]|uniref:GNAT family N-acetyltransferase n=1 Tax=Trichlorobacter lovleyi TaxID=313985 RepID=UPI0022407955|nr:GNAT family N-acetyltransferase [Trichlorobacter lovleyi]QOX77466.1 GNAT family N-acetyltransferase [Trichlorobacter lovleyi]